MGIISGLNVCPEPPQIRLVFSWGVAGRPASEKPTQRLHGPQVGLHLQVGTLVFAIIECDLLTLESDGKDFVPCIQGQTFFALSLIHSCRHIFEVVRPPRIAAALTDAYGVVVKVKLNECSDSRIIWHSAAQNGERHIVDRLASAEVRLRNTVQRIFADLVLQRGAVQVCNAVETVA